MPYDRCVIRTHLIIPATTLSVRQTLSQIFDDQAKGTLQGALSDTAQIVLSEALNNIVEHAYAETEGEIDLTLDICKAGLACTILDYGLPLPNHSLPAGIHPMEDEPQDLPEGGFGWFMIRTLAKDLGYLRQNNCNRLSFWIPAETNPSR